MAMSEGEITEQMVMMMDLTIAGASIFFSIVSAYIVALFYFLHKAPFALKATAFLFFTMTLAFLAVFATNSFAHSASLQQALVELNGETDLSAVGRAALRHGPADRALLDEVIRELSWGGMALVYAALGYFTFWHRWRDEDGNGKSPASETSSYERNT